MDTGSQLLTMKTASDEISDAAATELPQSPVHQEELPRPETAEVPVCEWPSQEPPVDGSVSGTVPPSPAFAEDQLLQKVLDKLQNMGVTPQHEAHHWSQHSWQN